MSKTNTQADVPRPAAFPRRKTPPVSSARAELMKRYQTVRQFSEKICETLVPEDYVIQTMPEMSPAKWHLAHVSWFFETFVLNAHVPGYKSLHPQYGFLFNSYYNAAGKMHARPQRGLISRPTVRETYEYRGYVDAKVLELLEHADDGKLEALARLITLGVNHEQQHQELILTDLKHLFWMNPLRPVFRGEKSTGGIVPAGLKWRNYDEGVYTVGHDGTGFCFDNEGPRHRVLLPGFALASRLVTNREYLAFMEAGGYERAEFWLSLGWNTINERGWNAPFYWEKRDDGAWWMMTLAGMRELRLDEPVCHVSYFEADAYARWAGARLPSESEWEVASQEVPVEGNFAEGGYFHPSPPREPSEGETLSQMFGDAWQWTQSSYSPYPGYEPVKGAWVSIMGNSCATNMCCAELPARRRGRMQEEPIETFFHRTPAGSSWASGWRGI